MEITRRRRRAFSLTEVLIATFIMSTLMAPIVLAFFTTAGGVGKDLRETAASSLAQEILEQVVVLHQRSPRLLPLVAERREEAEIAVDLDALWANSIGRVGSILFEEAELAPISHLHLSPNLPGFQRTLRIRREAMTRDDDPVRTPRGLFRVVAEVRYKLPTRGREEEKKVALTALLFSPPVLRRPSP